VPFGERSLSIAERPGVIREQWPKRLAPYSFNIRRMTEPKKKGTSSGFSAEERAAMRAAAAERKASQKQEDLDKALAETIANLPDGEREMAEKIDAIVRKYAPMLTSKTYYGMPGWARDGKVCVFMQAASKFKTRYSTIGFDSIANLDDGNMWPTSFAIVKIGPAEEKRIIALVKQAVS
jgi:uncharacterized protein YdhG (YjbR/CyaY superfamily)